MKLHFVFVAVAAIILAVALFAPQSEARIPRRKLIALKKLGLAAMLLKGKKKMLLPIPLPLPLPMPLVHRVPVHEPVAVAEPVKVALPEPIYAQPEAPAYPALPAYNTEYGAESLAEPAAYPGAY